MSTSEFTHYLSRIYPFDNLPRTQIEDCSNNLEIVHFKKGMILQKEEDEPKNLYFIYEGLVQEKSDNEVISVYSQNEFFDPISLIENYSKYTYVAIEDTTCYTMKREFFIKTLHQNLILESYFFQSISQKLNKNISNEKNKELVNIMLAKVKDAKIHRAVVVPYKTSIFDAATIIKKEKIPTLLLKDDDGEIYVVTDSDFRQKVILNRMDYDDCVCKICTGNLIYINENDFLFNAQLIMSKHSIKRLIVKNDEDEIVGIIDQISLSAFFSMHTFSVSNEIEEAQSLEELKKASFSFIKIIKSLNVKGVKVEFISKLINQLNRKLINQIIKLTAPKELIGNYCFLVMGSEGRSEQILRTDQDNALIIKDDCEVPEKIISEYTKQFTEILIDFGFPRCDGNIMVSNPYWCRTTSEFKKLIKSWVVNKKGDDFMNLAIFYDALCASGDRKLLEELKAYTFELCSNSQTFYTHFAKIIMDFNVPLGFFDGFVYDKDKDHKNEIDIKKGGIFILVQSIRSLSLEHKLFRSNTLKRIQVLNEVGVLEDELASELTEAFNFLTTLKLRANLQKLDAGKEIDNYICPKDLNSMDKDLLKESFKIVNKIKKKLESRYRLNYT